MIREAQVVNLHHVREFQSVETIARLLDLDKPIVWTLHDQAAFTGGCHYAGGCLRYRGDCRPCPQLDDDSRSIPHSVLMNKLKNWTARGPLTVVTPSRWLAACAVSSALFGRTRVEHIPNAVETDIFKPIPKPMAKRRLGWDPAGRVVMTGALNWNARRKGFRLFLGALGRCFQAEDFAREAANGAVRLVIFGQPAEEVAAREFPLTALGRVEDDDRLALIYAAADLFVLPSLEDNLPNNALEALACGTPVVAFEVGGIPDAVRTGETGRLVPSRDESKMGEAILDLIRDRTQRERLSRNSVALIEKEFSPETQARRYRSLFEDLSSRHRTSRPGNPGRLSEIDPDLYARLRPVFNAFDIHLKTSGRIRTASPSDSKDHGHR